jgi:hypothetical protein
MTEKILDRPAIKTNCCMQRANYEAEVYRLRQVLEMIVDEGDKRDRTTALAAQALKTGPFLGDA